MWETTVDIFSHHIFIWRAEPVFFFILTAETGNTLFHFLVTLFFSSSDLDLLVYFSLVLQPLSQACFKSQLSLKGYGQSATTESCIMHTAAAPSKQPAVHLRLVPLLLLNRFDGGERASPLPPPTTSSIHSVCAAPVWVACGHRLLILLPPLSHNPLSH